MRLADLNVNDQFVLCRSGITYEVVEAQKIFRSIKCVAVKNPNDIRVFDGQCIVEYLPEIKKNGR